MNTVSVRHLPEERSWELTIDTGEVLWFGPARSGDADLLGGFYESISPATRDLYAPHPFTREYARTFCAQVPVSDTVAYIVTDRLRTSVFAYFLLYLHVFPGEVDRYRGHGIDLDSARDCMFAPVVADAWQGRGLAGVVMPLFVQAARERERRKMILLSGTQRRNTRAIRFYERSGFRLVGYYGDDNFNQDMVLDLEPAVS